MKADLAKVRHARSVKDFPFIDLEEDEYVELGINRSKIGLILIWAGEVFGFIALTVVLVVLLSNGGTESSLQINEAARSYFNMIIFALYGVLLISGLVGTYIYNRNHLVVTNKRVFHQVRSNLLASSTNIIELQSIEDVSFQQKGLIDYIFRLGTIRMSTVGDETTYTFTYVDTPRDEIKLITHLVHKAKEKRLTP